jgi:hypothetical protein
MSWNSDLLNSLLRNGQANGPWNSHCNIALGIVAEGRLFGLNAGDWTVLISGFGLSALAVLLL